MEWESEMDRLARWINNNPAKAAFIIFVLVLVLVWFLTGEL